MKNSLCTLLRKMLPVLLVFSLLAIPAQAAFTLDPDGPGIVDAGGPKSPVIPGGDDSDEPGITIQSGDDGLPGPRDDLPGVC